MVCWKLMKAWTSRAMVNLRLACPLKILVVCWRQDMMQDQRIAGQRVAYSGRRSSSEGGAVSYLVSIYETGLVMKEGDSVFCLSCR